MALMECSECNNNISDQAEICPKCGYEIKKQDSTSTNKVNNYAKYIVIGLVIVVGFLLFNHFNKSKTSANPSNPTEPTTNNGNYVFNQNGMYFEYPATYKTYVDKNGNLYVGQYIDNNGALIPYIMIERYNYSDPITLLSDVETELIKSFPDITPIISLVNGQIGDKNVYGVAYSYTMDGHVIIDNRYAFFVGNQMYLLTTKEENVNTKEINNTSILITQTLKEVSR